ncbi:thermonuclease family protein [Rhizobium sp.]|uniref:thermonuclease family protein n=1 Tax=Rhizobium sp. TaxID=391 RepID=UPI0028A21C25
MRVTKIFFFACALHLAHHGGTQAQTLSGEAHLIDGDTLRLNGETIRLHGIDAPEAGQKCRSSGSGYWPCGEKAMDRLGELIAGPIACNSTERDMYGRLIAVCFGADGVDLNSVMVDEGHAWAFRRYSEDYALVEDRAKARGVGIWQAKTETPWDYRSQKWKVAQQTAPNGCPIKGNISSNGHIYHAPWSPWYTKTKVSVEKGEKWFCSEREAIDAGWRAPAWR